MGTSGEVPRAEEVLYESSRTRVSRVWCEPGGSVIRKTFLGGEAHRRLRHESAILGRLANLPGVVTMVEEPSTDSLTLRDAGSQSLAGASASGPLPVKTLLALAVELAAALAGVHGRGVIHRDITPANLLWSEESGHLTLIDFDLATTAAEKRPGFTHQNQIIGTLAYLAPEQTGRTGRPVDHRVDLYGVGSTLYQLATGAPPFGFTDPLRLIHDHLARVPIPPIDRNPALPQEFSDLVLRLLEKEPVRRYQSAEGLEHDLRAVNEAYRRGEAICLVLGERDFPSRLSAPSHLVGRDAELGVLREAFQASLAGPDRGLLVSGVPGVGKTSLVNELRPIVTGKGGWFVSGKFDQYRQDNEADAVRQALRGLGQLFLAEPEQDLVELRSRLLEAVDVNAGQLAANLPEFAAILGVPPEVDHGDPITMRARMAQAGLDLLRGLASPERPIVIVIDDLQWATPTPLSFIDAVLLDEGLRDVLLVGAYRQTEVDAAHPLAALLSRWERLGAAPRTLALTNLPTPALETMVAEMLRMDRAAAAPLADAIGEHTQGNPYDTVELINALRRDGALAVDADGWHWDPAAVRGYLGTGDVVALVTARIEALPPDTQILLQTLACLGGVVDVELLCDASGLTQELVEERLVPALEDGLLVTDDATGSISFRHDRVQQAAFASQTPQERSARRLGLARRLLAFPHWWSQAAEQYLEMVAAVNDQGELAKLVELFRSAATQALAVADHGRAERFISAALALLVPPGGAVSGGAVSGGAVSGGAVSGGVVSASVVADAAAVVDVATRRHGVLYCLGWTDQIEDAYRLITDLTDDPLALAPAAQLQMSYLTTQNRLLDAVELGLDLLRRLGIPIPDDPELLADEIARDLDVMYDWFTRGDETEDLNRPECLDPRVTAIATLLDRIIPPAYFSGHPAVAWALGEASRLWAERGPSRALAGPHAFTQFVTIGVRQDYRTGRDVVRRVLAYCDGRDYEPEASHIRVVYAVSCIPWFEPLEEAIRQARQGQERLIRAGEMQYAVDTYHVSLPDLVDCGATLDELAAEADAALTFAARIGSRQAERHYGLFRRFVDVLRGDSGESTGPEVGSTFWETGLTGSDSNQTTVGFAHVVHGLVAAILGNSEVLIGQAAAVTPLIGCLDGSYIMIQARLVRALALAERARATRCGAPEPERAEKLAELLAEFDVERDWLAERAKDSPASVNHLVRLCDAERAWAAGDFLPAAHGFDAALRLVSHRRRPWHHALIAEHAAGFLLEYGFEHAGETLLREARRCYHGWGAAVKVADLDQRYPGLKIGPPGLERDLSHSLDTSRSGTVSTEEIDLLGVLDASRALSSETDLNHLRAHVKSVLSAMTGATTVRLVMWNDETKSWFLPTDDGEIGLDTEAASRSLPMFAFRYADRTQEPLVVDDVTQDERFDRDPYLAGLDCCSLLIVPILSRGTRRAMLLLENQISRAVFTADRLGSVMLIAGQLAVSLDNALLYASLERKVAQRTQQLDLANQRLEALSVTDALTGLANRRRLTEVLDQEWRRALAQKEPLSIAMIDIDYFKLYNDHYGHLAGDECLRRVAGAIAQNVRATDLAARYGGEEFLIVMPGVTLAAARKIAERVRRSVIDLCEAHAESPLGCVTISVGVATSTFCEGASPVRLIELADEGLYLAKRHGRNQVGVSDSFPISAGSQDAGTAAVDGDG